MTKLLYIDPGHGGHDSGAAANGMKEKDLVLDISKRIKSYIEKNYDIDCRLSRSTDRFFTLSDRTKEANKLGADCLVSIHINAAGATSANGFESFVYTTDGPTSKSVALQEKLHSIAPLWTGKGRKDRGKKKANFHMVREFKGAAVLLEFGFLSNKDDAELLADKAFLQANAVATADAIASHLGVKKKEKSESTIYRVVVEGAQVGAFAEPSNVLDQVEQAISQGKTNLSISKV